MSRFFGFVKKEFQHIFRDVRTLVILFVLPVVMIVLFGFVVTTEIRDVEVGILDRSMDQASIRATQKIFSSGYFISAGYLQHEEEIGEFFRSGTAKVVVYEVVCFTVFYLSYLLGTCVDVVGFLCKAVVGKERKTHKPCEQNSNRYPFF